MISRKLYQTVEDSALELLRHIEKQSAGGKQIDMLKYVSTLRNLILRSTVIFQVNFKLFQLNNFLEKIQVLPRVHTRRHWSNCNGSN